MNTKKVLIADDEIDVLELMEKKIKAEGYDVISAEDGAKAWDLIKETDPDIIVLDLNMPYKHGFEVLKLIRENPMRVKWQAVIIVSAQNELRDMKQGYSLDADHYIAKPCSMSDIIKAIKLMENIIPQRISE